MCRLLIVMKEYLVCHSTVSGGDFNATAVTKVEKLLDSHNFVNKVDLLVRGSDLEQIKSDVQAQMKLKKILGEANLSQLLGFLLRLNVEQRSALKLVTLDKDITHDNSICVTKGNLTLKLRSDSYLKSGLQCKLSAFSRGNKNLKSQMYIHNFDMLNFENNVKLNRKNEIRLLWYAENVSVDVFKFTLTSESDNIDTQLVPKLEEEGITLLGNREVESRVFRYNQVLHPDLTITKDEDTLAETLEWLSYASIGGLQLRQEVDPFISRYPTMLESSKRSDFAVLSIDKTLISSKVQKLVFSHVSSRLDWFALFSYGVKNVSRSYNSAGEHYFVDDGANDIVVFSQEGKYALWEITDSGDPH